MESYPSFDLFLHFFPDYAAPAVAPVGQKVGSTFRPSSDEGYTTPFTFNHYDTPGNLPEYAEPLPPEPEYATPFSERPSESHGLSIPAPTSGSRTTSSHARYDCPSHRIISNGYCTPTLHASGPRPVSVVYAEPQSWIFTTEAHIWGAFVNTVSSDMEKKRLSWTKMCVGTM